MEGVVNVKWHGQDYLHLKWHVVSSGLATPGLNKGRVAVSSLSDIQQFIYVWNKQFPVPFNQNSDIGNTLNTILLIHDF